MKAASTLIHVFALGACLAVQASSSGESKMAGVRRAIQTIAATELHFLSQSLSN